MNMTQKKQTRADIQTPAVSANDDASRLVVGRELTLRGEINACQHLVIEGVVESESLRAQRLDVLENGIFSGVAQAQKAIIAGKFDGQLTVTGPVVIKATAMISGDIRYGQLQIEPGARISGRLEYVQMAETVEGETAQIINNVESLFSPGRGQPRNDIPRAPRRVEVAE